MEGGWGGEMRRTGGPLGGGGSYRGRTGDEGKTDQEGKNRKIYHKNH